ncbi:MAG TPA: carboxylesterase family protein [Allosphingosinicella sp.]|nr:carboxylesterase family protein [Allosphingosinicella sp.]
MTVFTTGLGPVEGVAQGDCIRVSRLRYAKPPVGSRRFAMPEPVGPWSESPAWPGPAVAPPQLPSRLARVIGDYGFEQSEDCLHLDIWIPRESTGPLPVLVFLHGGAFQTGGGSLECYDGAVLAARERMIVVNVSFRLGLLGFMSIEGFAPPNLGLHDQIAALRFIRAEIAAFGGDPWNITLSGQSAGAFSVAVLMMHPEGRSLFARAIQFSGMFGSGTRNDAQARALEASFLARLDLDRNKLENLRECDISKLLEVQAALTMETLRSSPPDQVALPFLPFADGDIVPESPMAKFESGVSAWCPLMIGATREEYAAFWFDSGPLAQAAGELLEKRFAEAFPDSPEAALARARACRSPRSDLAVLIDFHTQTRMVEPAFRAAAAQAQAGGTAYAYRFDWQSPNPEIGACHCIELPFLFGNLDIWQDAPMIAGARREELEGICDSVQGAVGSFVRTGDPSPGLGFEWPAYGIEGPVLYVDRLSHCGPSATYPS